MDFGGKQLSASTTRRDSASLGRRQNGMGNGPKILPKEDGRGKKPIDKNGNRRPSRRGSNSLGRRNRAKENLDSDQVECENCMELGEKQQKMRSPNSAERHRNEKILTADSIIRLPGRSSFYKMFESSGSQIGQGTFSDVYLVYNSEYGAKYAVKEIDKHRMRNKLHFVANEIALLQRLRHRNICRLVDAYECQNHYFLVFEYAQKGDLFETIKRIGRLCERSAAQISKQIASALAFLHRRQIVHRDVKPENILLCADSTVKLTDFGLACVVLGSLYRVCGTPTYVAPEVLTQEGYGVQVDIWSLGIILHICLAGFAPFRCVDRAQLFKQIVRAKITFEMACWNRITFKAKQLILGMLVANPNSRPNADELLRNEWILMNSKAPMPITSSTSTTTIEP